MDLATLAGHLDGELVGDPAARVTSVASLLNANESSVTFFADHRRLEDLNSCRAGLVLLREEHLSLFSGNRLVVSNPYAAFVVICHVLHPEAPVVPGVDPTANISDEAEISETASIGPGCQIGRGTRIGDGVSMGALCVVGHDVELGAGTRLEANVTIYDNCHIGSACRIESGAVIGSSGFGYVEGPEGWNRIPQLGRVIIGNQVDIGANTAIDRGSLDDTIIGDGVKLDNQVQVAHNVRIGENTAIAGCTGIAGSAVIGRRCKIGGQVAVLGHLTVADDVQINATSCVTTSINEAGIYSCNLTVRPVKGWLKNVARIAQLNDLFRRVKLLEKRGQA